jgi:signal transduction histidine kinase
MLWSMQLSSTDGTAAPVLTVLREMTTAPMQSVAAHAQDQLRLLGQVAASVSHEIYNPLNAILLHADILEEELNQPDGANRGQLLHSLEVMKTRVAQLHDMIQEYLVLARLGDLSSTPEDLGALLEAFSLEMRQRLLAHGIVVTMQDIAGLGHVPLHKPTFWRALCNVEQYAVQAMPHGGTLTLHGQRFTAHVRLDIHDTGTGLSEKQRDCLSSPPSTTGTETKGLGLYLVREVVMAHHGQFAVTSEPGMGTTITMTLPLFAVEASPAL